MGVSFHIRLNLNSVLLALITPFVTLIAYPLVSTIFVPLWIYRTIINYVVHKSYPKVSEMLTGMDALFAGRDPYNKPIQVVITGSVLKNKLELTQALDILKKKLYTSEGKLLYPRLSQKIVQHYGYNFMSEMDVPFRFEDHVKDLNPERPSAPVTRSELYKIIGNSLVTAPFDTNRSPWDITIVSDFVDEKDASVKSIILIRWNHCLFDGYGGGKLCSSLALVKPWMDSSFSTRPHDGRRELFSWVMGILELLVTAPYHVLNMIFFTNDKHVLLQGKQGNPVVDHGTESISIMELERISMERLKVIRSQHQVCLSSVIIAMAAETTRYLMEVNGEPRPLPNKIHALIALPLPGHPMTLTNHWAFVKLPIYFSRKDDPVETLKNVDKEYKRLINSCVPLLGYYVNNLMGLLPTWAQQNTEDIINSSFVLTNFPGPKHTTDILGCQMEEAFIGGSAWDGTGMGFSSSSVCGTMRVVVGSRTWKLAGLMKERKTGAADSSKAEFVDENPLVEFMMETLRTLETKTAGFIAEETLGQRFMQKMKTT